MDTPIDESERMGILLSVQHVIQTPGASLTFPPDGLDHSGHKPEQPEDDD